MKIEELKVNGETVAKYHMDGDVIYLKILKKGFSEDIAIATISFLEGREFKHAAYLNV